MIQIIKVKDKSEGRKKAYDILEKIVDSKTLLALSGGTSPDYKKMLLGISSGAICVVDERYGKPFHKDSNELLIKKFGIKSFNKILQGHDFLQTAKDYEKLIEELFAKFPKKIGIMGIGSNLHTAGIFPYSVAAKSPNFVEGEVVKNQFPKRVTLTLKALGEFSNFVILMFGEDKKKTLKKLLDENQNDMQKYPAIFYRKAPIQSYLITDIDI